MLQFCRGDIGNDAINLIVQILVESRHASVCSIFLQKGLI